MSGLDPHDYHVARLVLLIGAMTSRGPALEGLTKLAKLDFLLRYPLFLESLLARRNLSWPSGTQPSEAERHAVESRMVRYKYGPWDHRYYPLLGALIGRGLARWIPGERAVAIELTEDGRAVASGLRETEDWALVAARCELLARHFDKTGAQLKSLIYTELPEAIDRPHRTTI